MPLCRLKIVVLLAVSTVLVGFYFIYNFVVVVSGSVGFSFSISFHLIFFFYFHFHIFRSFQIQNNLKSFVVVVVCLCSDLAFVNLKKKNDGIEILETQTNAVIVIIDRISKNCSFVFSSGSSFLFITYVDCCFVDVVLLLLPILFPLI